MLERLINLIKQEMPDLDVSDVKESSKLMEDLGMDSVGMMMLSMAIEDEFKVRFTEPVFFETVQDVLDWLKANGAK